MSREWRLNPPPNWPLAAGVVVGLDWQPDPTWGPPPIGWQLWRRERVSRWRPLTQTVLGLILGTIVLAGVWAGVWAGASAGEPIDAPAQSVGRTTLIEPGAFPAGSIHGLPGTCTALRVATYGC